MQIISLNRGPVNLVAFDQLAKVVHGAVLIWIKSTEPRKRKKTTNKNTRGVIIVNTNTNTNTFSIDVIHTYMRVRKVNKYKRKEMFNQDERWEGVITDSV